MRDVIEAIATRLEASQEVLLCQVVETKGSTPQKAGAVMVVDPNGGQIGTLGGGCVEAEVKQKAIRRLGEAGAELFTFVLDHDQAWADGLVCGGKMTILAEALAPSAAEYYRAMLSALAQGQPLFEAIDLRPGNPGRRWLLSSGGEVVITHRADDAPPPPLPAETRQHRARPQVQGGIAFLPLMPRIRLVIVGAGHVGQAVAALASQVDFDVWVIDDRAQFANATRFPNAQNIIVAPIDGALRSLTVDLSTYLLIMTRGHGHDQEALELAAVTPASYVGLIGSKRKIRMIFEALKAKGVPESALARVTAPIGLDIGSESVPEIAVSIVAQLIAKRNLPADAP